MNIQSHLLVAMAMERYIKDKYGVTLRSEMFYYGNIRPDFTPRGGKKSPHTFSDSLPVFMRHCNHLVERSQLVRPPKYILSYKLGLILHYTADFFTYAHHDPNLFCQTAAHFKYENELLEVIWKTKRKNPGLPISHGKRLDVFLIETLQLYDKRIADPYWDADFIYYVSQIVCDRIIERIYLEKKIRKSRWTKVNNKIRS